MRTSPARRRGLKRLQAGAPTSPRIEFASNPSESIVARLRFASFAGLLLPIAPWARPMQATPPILDGWIWQQGPECLRLRDSYMERHGPQRRNSKENQHECFDENRSRGAEGRRSISGS